MPKVITSPVTTFPGTVTLKDPIPLAACVEWEAALAECQASPCSEGRRILMGMLDADDAKRDEVIKQYAMHFNTCSEVDKKCKPGLRDTAAQARMLKAVKACVETWDVPAFDMNNPPGSPKAARSKFVAWLIGQVTEIYMAEEPTGDPNA